MWCCHGISEVVKDAWIQGVPDGAGEAWSVAAAQGVTPLDFVEDDVVFRDQGGVGEEPFDKGGLDTADSFAVGGTEVGAEREANLEEQVVC